MERMPPLPNYSHTYDNKRNQKKTKKRWVKLSRIKGYLRYKMINSQNVSSEAQVKNFFIS